MPDGLLDLPFVLDELPQGGAPDTSATPDGDLPTTNSVEHADVIVMEDTLHGTGEQQDDDVDAISRGIRQIDFSETSDSQSGIPTRQAETEGEVPCSSAMKTKTKHEAWDKQSAKKKRITIWNEQIKTETAEAKEMGPLSE